MSYNPGSSSVAIASATDVALSSQLNEQALVYNSSTAKWVNQGLVPTTQTLATQHNDGSTDASSYLSGLISTASTAASTAQGITPQAIVLYGTYRCDASIAMYSNVIIDARQARIIKNFSDSGSLTGGLISPAVATTKVNNVTIIGGVWGGADTTKTGNIFSIYGDDWTLLGCKVDQWTAGRAYAILGNRAKFINCVATGSTLHSGDGGLRVLGGDDGLAVGCHIESGDDALQVVPSGSGYSSNPQFYNVDVNRWTFNSCTGYSVRGRFINVGLQNRDTTAEMTTSVRDCKWVNCVGQGGCANSWHFNNDNSTGDIDGIDIIGCYVEEASSQGSSVELSIGRTSTQYKTKGGMVGAVRNINIENIRIRNPKRMIMQIYGGAQDITIRGFHFGAPHYKAVTGASTVSGSSTVTFSSPQVDQTDVGAPLVGTGIPTASCVIESVAGDGQSLTIWNPAQESSKTASQTGSGLSMYIGATNLIDISGAVRARFLDCRFDSNGQGDLILAGGSDTTLTSGEVVPGSTTDAYFKNCLFTGIGNGFYGVNFSKTSGAVIDSCLFQPASGATTPGGLYVAAASSRVRVIPGNDFSSLPNSSDRVNSLASDTVITTGNLGV